MSLPVTIAKGIGVTTLFLVRNAPTILTAGGVCAMIGATATAVKESLRYHEEVSEPAITDLALAEVEGDEKKRDAAKWRLIINTARRYAPTIVLTAAGIAMISAGHGMMRIIPARAGFTPPLRRRRRRRRDHPRSRGVYVLALRQYLPCRGSSPLARGLPFLDGFRGVEDRIIPARAGFTGVSPTGTYRWEDHPRSRGVYRASRSLV